MTADGYPAPATTHGTPSGDLTRARRISYAIGSIGAGVFTTVPSVLLLYFLITEVRLQAAVAGIIVLIPKMLGLVGDPLVGVWTDRLRRRSGLGRPVLMLGGALMTGLGLFALFSLPQRHPGDMVLPVVIYTVCTAGYSLFAVPYSALPPELEPRPVERGRLVSMRLGVSFVGALVGGVSAPLLATRIGYPVMALALGAVCVLAMSISLVACPRVAPALAARSATRSLRETFAPVLNASFGRSIFAFVLLLASAGAFTALLPFLVRDMRANAAVVSAAMLVNLVLAALTAALWPRMIGTAGLRLAWIAAAMLMAAGAIAIALAPGPTVVFFLGAAVCGAGFSGVQVAGFTSLADLAAGHYDQGGGGGLLTGLWMAGEKAGLAGGPLLAGLGLQFMPVQIAGSSVRTLLVLIPTILVLSAGVILGGLPKRNAKPAYCAP